MCSKAFFKTLRNLDFLLFVWDCQQCINVQKWYKWKKLLICFFLVFCQLQNEQVIIYNSFSRKSLNCLENFKGMLSFCGVFWLNLKLKFYFFGAIFVQSKTEEKVQRFPMHNLPHYQCLPAVINISSSPEVHTWHLVHSWCYIFLCICTQVFLSSI